MKEKPDAIEIIAKIVMAPVVGILLPVILVVEVFKSIFGIKGDGRYAERMAEEVGWIWLMFLGAIVAAPFIYLFAMGLAGYGVLWATGGIALVTMIGGAALLLM